MKKPKDLMLSAFLRLFDENLPSVLGNIQTRSQAGFAIYPATQKIVEDDILRI